MGSDHFEKTFLEAAPNRFTRAAQAVHFKDTGVNRLANLTPHGHPFLTLRTVGFAGSARLVGAGRDSGGETSAGDVIVVSAFESPTVVDGFNDVAVMGQPVEQRCGHLGIAEHARPFAEGEIGGDDDGGARS